MSKKRKKALPEIPEIKTPIEEKSLEMLESVDTVKAEMEEYFGRLLDEDLSVDAEQKSESMKRAAMNMRRASKNVSKIRDELNGRTADIRRQKKKNKLFAAPSNASIDIAEEERDHFARGLNLYKILLLCFIGSFVGVVIETIWCLVTRGYIESRAGLVYGPFNLLYGMGVVTLTVCLYKFRNRGAWLSFLGGTLVGSVVEYICSWGQELVFGSRSWDYSAIPFNLNGRICLLYSIFWGILGVLWIKNLYPRVAKLILKIPNKAGKIITWAVTAFLIIDVIVSGISLMRWSQRNQGIEASNSFWEFIDERFPDERMEKVYANMEFSD